MSISVAIIALGLLIFLAHIFNALFEHIKIPSVLMLIFIGIAVGPAALNFISPRYFGSFGSVFTTITLIVILFESGTGLSFSDIKKSIGSATALTIVCFVKTMALAAGLLYFFTNLDLMSCFFLGATLGGTSSAVVIPMVRQLKLGEKTSVILFLESAFSDVLCLIVGLAVLESMQRGVISVGQIFIDMFISLTAASIIGAFLGLVWTIVQRRVLQNIKNTMFASFALAFIIYGTCDLIKLNGGIAVLVFGIIIGNIEYFESKGFFKKFASDKDVKLNAQERSFFSEIGFVLQTYFFVYVGISLKFTDLKTMIAGTILTILIYIGRNIVVRTLINKNTSKFEKEMCSIMAPKGLIAAVLASMPLQYGLAQGEKIQGIAYSVVLLSIIITSLLAANVKRQKRKFDLIETENKTNTEQNDTKITEST